MIKTLAKNIKGFVKESVLTPFFMILEVVVETIIPLRQALQETSDAQCLQISSHSRLPTLTVTQPQDLLPV